VIDALAVFSDPEGVARYIEGPPRIVPGYEARQRMTMLLLAERVPEKGRVLVLGAGGGLELNAFAEAQSGWSFDCVDLAPEMLKLAERIMGRFAQRTHLHQGDIDDAP
jgi:tRNA (cmo5U34)-methyltransferase